MLSIPRIFQSVRSIRPHAACALALLLAGCAGIAPPTATPGETEVPTSAPAFHDAIDLNGRLSVRYQQDGKEESVHGSFTWAQTAQHTIVTLLSPLGQTMATIDATPAGSTLLQAGKPPRAAADVDTLVADTLGWPLPISGLRHWLQGFIVDANGKRFSAAVPSTDGFATRDGWRIRYVSWESDAPSAPNRPKRIDLERYTPQAGEVSIRIVIDAWQTH